MVCARGIKLYRDGRGEKRDGTCIYTAAMKFASAFACTLLLAVSVAAQTIASKTLPDHAPASMKQMSIPSHGSMLLGVLYLAAGAEPHPTAIILHGFPGFEQNLDLAQTLRAHGWNVLAMHYRGSWGVKGDFSFQHAAEDADTEVGYVLTPRMRRNTALTRIASSSSATAWADTWLLPPLRTMRGLPPPC